MNTIKHFQKFKEFLFGQSKLDWSSKLLQLCDIKERKKQNPGYQGYGEITPKNLEKLINAIKTKKLILTNLIHVVKPY